ncbi:hypothetical protein D915_009185 [Fasciola hepatica]|uniref:Vps16 C-terminal domain-containing protein n=1 Tax=Fasciola hepatica TaxID=6192 RepID=A0A4E0R173_FASHE|nr:hypothetical protein D915_009185 [Fasciola hepatica]
MLDDSLWDDTDVLGFRFDWDDTDPVLGDTALVTDWNYIDQINLVDQEAIASEIEKQICDVCHQVITDSILYEKNASFCSEECWQRVLHTSLDDFTVGGISAWPIDTFLSLKAKTFLVELASKSYDGNMIVKILCSIQATLSPQLFKRLVLKNAVVFEHFTNFLRKTNQHELLRDLLSSELVSEPALDRLHEACVQLADLLDFQFLYQDAWRSYCLSQKSDDAASLLALSLAETIRICCEMDKTVGLGSRVHQLRTQHKVFDDQFRWLVVEPLLHSGNWPELEVLLLEKKWLKRRVGTTLPNDRLVMYLHALCAPEDVLSGYLELSSDRDELLDIALRLRMYKFAVACCAKRRDASGMKNLSSRIPKKEPEHAKILYYLSLPVNQWRENKT